MERWSGKTAVVTGASSEIGAALSVRLANHGLTVVGLTRRHQLIDDLFSKVSGMGKIVSRQCDVTKPEDIAAAFRWVGHELDGVDVLVNNASMFKQGNVTNIGDDESIIDVNYKSMVVCTKKAVDSMKERHFDGDIINICSVLKKMQEPLQGKQNLYN